MAELAQSDIPPYVPPGRPVPRFVAGVIAAALLLGVVAVVGPFRADVRVDAFEWRYADDHAIVRATIGNDSRFPIDVVAFGGPGLRSSAPLLTAEGAQPEIEAGLPLGNVRLEPGESTVVTARIAPDCASYFGPTGPPLQVEVELLLGVERTVNAGMMSIDTLAQDLCRRG